LFLSFGFTEIRHGGPGTPRIEPAPRADAHTAPAVNGGDITPIVAPHQTKVHKHATMRHPPRSNLAS